jgi:hypothetical protein
VVFLYFFSLRFVREKIYKKTTNKMKRDGMMISWRKKNAMGPKPYS